MTCEVTPHHLLCSRADLDELGTFGRMNPPLRSEKRREGVFERVANGNVDIVATDHAPHTRAEKGAGIWDAPSGVPGVETALPRKGRIEGGRDADFALFDTDSPREIRGEDLHSKAGWTPFEGRRGVFPDWTMVRGTIVYERTADGDRFGDACGEIVRSGE